MKEKERGFESLQFYQDSLKLLKASYKLGANLPNYERYNLSDQLRRAAWPCDSNRTENNAGRIIIIIKLEFFARLYA